MRYNVIMRENPLFGDYVGGIFKTLMNHKVLCMIALGMLAMVLIGAVLGDFSDAPCVRECDNQGLNCQRECGAGHCVDGDDWGYPKLYVSAQSKDLNISPNAPLEMQYAEGIDSGQILLDAQNQNLVIKIRNTDKWTSWFGGSINPTLSNGQKSPDGYDYARQVPDRECLYWLPSDKKGNTQITIPSSITGPIASTSTQTSSPRAFAQNLSPTTLKLTKDYREGIPSSVQDSGQTKSPTQILPLLIPPVVGPDRYADSIVPCYFKYGTGLFVGLAPDNGTRSSPDDVVLAYHIPDSKRPDYAYDSTRPPFDNAMIQARDGYLVRGLPKDELPGAQTGDRLYFKIVDNAYIDNDGGYHVMIPEGTRNAKEGPLETISNIFITPMNYVVQRLYSGIVHNSIYINAVRAALVLYIIFYGFLILMGGMNLQEARKDLLFRLAKMCLVLMLISPTSWDFFYNHFFAVFLGGSQAIAALLTNPFGDYDPLHPWYSLDQLLHKLWSAETWSKISSTLMSNSSGILFIFVMLCANIIFVFAVVRALCIYLISYGSICILIVIFPIFLIFILFDKLKQPTETVVNQLFVFSMQQIFLFAALGMFSAVIIMFLEKTIGYHTCWNIYHSIKVNLGELGSVYMGGFKYWMPDINVSPESLQPIWVDADGDGIKEMVTRYVDLPYFDIVLDNDKIAQYQKEKDFISLADILIFGCAVYLMYQFMSILDAVTAAMKSVSSFDTKNIFGSGGGFAGSMQSIGEVLLNTKTTHKNKPTFGSGVIPGVAGVVPAIIRSPLVAKGLYDNFAKTETGKWVADKISGTKAAHEVRNLSARFNNAKKSLSENIGITDSKSEARQRARAMNIDPYAARLYQNLYNKNEKAIVPAASLNDPFDSFLKAPVGSSAHRTYTKDIINLLKDDNSAENTLREIVKLGPEEKKVLLSSVKEWVVLLESPNSIKVLKNNDSADTVLKNDLSSNEMQLLKNSVAKLEQFSNVANVANVADRLLKDDSENQRLKNSAKMVGVLINDVIARDALSYMANLSHEEKEKICSTIRSMDAEIRKHLTPGEVGELNNNLQKLMESGPHNVQKELKDALRNMENLSLVEKYSIYSGIKERMDEIKGLSPEETNTLNDNLQKLRESGPNSVERELAGSIKSFATADLFSSDKNKVAEYKKELSWSIISALKDERTAETALAMMANDKESMKNVHKYISSQIADIKEQGLSKEQEEALRRSLIRLEIGIDTKTTRYGY